MDISCSEAREMVMGGAQLLDVRSAAEFAEGAAPGAMNIPVGMLVTAAPWPPMSSRARDSSRYATWVRYETISIAISRDIDIPPDSLDTLLPIPKLKFEPVHRNRLFFDLLILSNIRSI